MPAVIGFVFGNKTSMNMFPWIVNVAPNITSYTSTLSVSIASHYAVSVYGDLGVVNSVMQFSFNYSN